MSVDTSHRMIDDYLASLLAGEDFSRFFTPDVVWTTMETGEQVRGREQVRDHIIRLHRHVFDAHPEVRRVIVGEDAAALEADFVGTQKEEFAGIPSAGATVTVPYAVIYEISSGGIAALRAYIPIAAMVAQLQGAAAGG